MWAHLALGRVANAPHSCDHGQRSCWLSGTLLPRHRLISKWTITARSEASGETEVRKATGADTGAHLGRTEGWEQRGPIPPPHRGPRGLRGEGSRNPHSPMWHGGQGRFHGVCGVHWLLNSLKARSAGGRKRPSLVLTWDSAALAAGTGRKDVSGDAAGRPCQLVQGRGSPEHQVPPFCSD